MHSPRAQFTPGIHATPISIVQSGQQALFPELSGSFVPTNHTPLPFQSPHVSIFGLNTGDEGKGRSVLEIASLLRYLTGDQDCVGAVLKANGGANSGHTAAGIKLNLIPSGVAEPSIAHLCLCRGVVADPCKLVWETKALESVGYETLSRLRLDNRLMVSHVGHRLLDLAAEIRSPRGSTGRGISPSYSDESIQGQIFYEAFLGDMAAFSAALEKRLTSATRRIQHEFMLSPEEWNGLFEKLSMAERRAHAALIAKGVLSDSDFDFQRFRHPSQPFSLNMRRIVDCYWEAGTRLAAAITDVTQLSRELSEQKKHLIYEHGQGVLLDKRLGFTPSVTASHTTPAEVHHTNAVPITQSIYAVGVAKAYSTKVGVHLFLTQMEAEHPLAKILSKIEFGTTTGRGRMVGWYDAVEGGWALTHAGAHALIINKLDVLTLSGDWQGPLKICTHYVDPDGNRHFSLPTSDERRKQMTACYEECAGWTEEIQNIRNFTELPLAAQQYVAKLYQATIAAAQGGSIVEYENLPKLHFVGVGPDPGQIICDLPSPQELLRLAKL